MTAPIKHYTRRRIIQIVGRAIQLVLARVTITGRENLPKHGPLIVVGNHVGYAEPALMVTTMPWPVELVAAGDIPLRSKFLFLQNMYGFLPVNRGEIDRTALKAISDILGRGGSVGIFPEGGIWDRKIGDARMGVAYISQQTQVPILPMGFGGVVGALDKTIRLKRPKVSVHIGKLLPPVPTSENYRERKALAQTASNQIMQAIYDLVPPDDEINQLGSREEAFQLDIQFTDAAGKVVAPPPELGTVPHADEVALLFHRPVLLSVVIDNMERAAAEPLRHLETERDPAAFSKALEEALHVYTKEKPVFLGYRLGYQRAERITQGLQCLLALAQWAASARLSMNIMPIAKLTYADGSVKTFNYPTEAHQAG
jgi:1-acyl-sn-glycerol-3-phosphate acyltransferase